MYHSQKPYIEEGMQRISFKTIKKDYNVANNGQNFIDQPVKIDEILNKKIEI